MDNRQLQQQNKQFLAVLQSRQQGLGGSNQTMQVQQIEGLDRIMIDFKQGRIPKEHPNFEICLKLAQAGSQQVKQYIQQEQLCIICHKAIDIRNRVQLTCGHLFDIECIEQWVIHQSGLNKTPSCPVCRTII